MKKLLIAFAAAGTLGIAALATTADAEARGRGGHGIGGGGGFRGIHHGGGFRHGGFRHSGFGVRHFGHRHHGFRHYGYRWNYGVRTVGVYTGGSCWQYRWTSYGYRYVNVCVRPLYY